MCDSNMHGERIKIPDVMFIIQVKGGVNELQALYRGLYIVRKKTLYGMHEYLVKSFTIYTPH
jgi:hypothetical protein